MFSYEKRLQFPVNITSPNAKLAQAIISQYGGPDGDRVDYKTRIVGVLTNQDLQKIRSYYSFGVCTQNPNCHKSLPIYG